MPKSRRFLFPICLAALGFVALPGGAMTQLRAGAPFAINSQTIGQQRTPAVARAADGTLVVAWRSEGGPGDPSVRVRRFSSAGAALGPELVANLTTPAFGLFNRLTLGFSADPVVAADGAGNFLVVWAGPAGNIDIRARLFRPDGTPVGGEIVVNTDTSGDQARPAVAALDGGGFVVVWEGLGIRGRRIDANGTPLSSEISFGIAGFLPLVIPSQGGFVLGWTEGEDVDEGAFVQLYRNDGSSLGAAVAVAPVAAGDQFLQALAAGPAGTFLAVWGEGGDFSPAPLPDLRAQRFNTLGQKVGGVIEVADQNDGPQFGASAGIAADGAFAISWSSLPGAAPLADAAAKANQGLFVRAFDPAGAPLGPAQRVQTLPGSPADEGALAMEPDGDFVVVGTGQDATGSLGIFGQRYVLRCEAGANILCLHGGRFQVETTWRTGDGTTGAGVGVPLSSDTGLFWFFNAANIEMVLKILDGCPVNQSYWVFAGGLTDVQVEIRVTDTTTQKVKTYVNPQGTPFQPIQDTSAFASCP